MLSRGVRVFRQVTCYFRSGSEWEADPVTFRPAVENMSQDAHFVTVPLGGRTAKSIKCRFHFSDQWMLFSEVAFQSGKCDQVSSIPQHGWLKWMGALWFYFSSFSSHRLCSLQHISVVSQTWTSFKHTTRSATYFLSATKSSLPGEIVFFWSDTVPCWQYLKLLIVKPPRLVCNQIQKRLSKNNLFISEHATLSVIFFGRWSHSQSGWQQYKDPDWLLGGYHSHPINHHSHHTVAAGLAKDAWKGKESALYCCIISVTFLDLSDRFMQSGQRSRVSCVQSEQNQLTKSFGRWINR